MPLRVRSVTFLECLLSRLGSGGLGPERYRGYTLSLVSTRSYRRDQSYLAANPLLLMTSLSHRDVPRAGNSHKGCLYAGGERGQVADSPVTR
jgi:hypothetical protein